MEHYRMFKEGSMYFIERVAEHTHRLEVPEKYLKLGILILLTWERLKRIGQKFYDLWKKGVPIDLSEYDLLQVIKVMYVQNWNIPSGEFWKEYYSSSYDGANKELLNMLSRNGG